MNVAADPEAEVTLTLQSKLTVDISAHLLFKTAPSKFLFVTTHKDTLYIINSFLLSCILFPPPPNKGYRRPGIKDLTKENGKILIASSNNLITHMN